MSASGPPEGDAIDEAAAELVDVRRLFGQMRELAREASSCPVPVIRRDAELIIALAEQALELLEGTE